MSCRDFASPRCRRALALIGLALALALGLGGCASKPAAPGRTSVVLLPDDDGKVGAVAVTAAGATAELSQAWHASRVDGRGGAPTAAQPVDATALQGRHAALLKAQPAAPRTMVVYFQVNKAVLTEASAAQLPAVLAAIRERGPTEITIFGHADPSGARVHNLRLSAERAQAVADWLRAADPSIGPIRVQYFGESKPPADTDAGADMSLHRRAEIHLL